MTSLDKAKAFSRLKKTALIILPLAAAAIQARADVILQYTGGSFNSSGAGISLSGGTVHVSGLAAVNGITGLTFWGSATYTMSSGGSSITACNLVCGGLSVFGTANPDSYTSDLAIDYDFIVSDNNGDQINWTVVGEALTAGLASNSVGGTANSGAELSGTLLIPTTGQSLSNWFADIEVDFNGGFAGGDTLSINVPGNATLNATGAVGTPEPGTFALMGSGAAALALLLRRRKRVRC